MTMVWSTAAKKFQLSAPAAEFVPTASTWMIATKRINFFLLHKL
jgi:hypothetical protein